MSRKEAPGSASQARDTYRTLLICKTAIPAEAARWALSGGARQAWAKLDLHCPSGLPDSAGGRDRLTCARPEPLLVPFSAACHGRVLTSRPVNSHKVERGSFCPVRHSRCIALTRVDSWTSAISSSYWQLSSSASSSSGLIIASEALCRQVYRRTRFLPRSRSLGRKH